MMEKAQQSLHTLFYANVSNEDDRFEFDLFNVSVTQKVWSTERYFKELESLDINNFQEPPYGIETKSDDLAGSDTKSVSTMTSRTRPVNIPEYCRHLNRLLDGFFMNSISALDTLAHLISTLYTLDRKPEKIYIWSVNDMLLPYHRHSKVRDLLEARLVEPWFDEVLPFRNCTTHESLIMYDITLKPNQLTSGYQQPKIVLPVDPQAKRFTYYPEREAISYCKFILGKIQSLVMEVYETILVDIHNADDVLPIPGTCDRLLK
jgi:hypothetical protein